jgi:negative regulator of sigma E activity
MSKSQRNDITKMKEEQEIIKKCGKGTPFRVPEGYFDDFAKKLMAHLPVEDSTMMESESAEPRITPWQHIKPWIYMAAMFVGMIICVRVVLGVQPENNATDNIGNITALDFDLSDFEQMSDEDLASVVEYTMMDNYTLYQYLSDAE